MSVDRRVGMKRTTRRVLAAVSAAVLVSPCVRAFAGDESPDPAAASSPQIQQWSLEQLLNIDMPEEAVQDEEEEASEEEETDEEPPEEHVREKPEDY